MSIHLGIGFVVMVPNPELTFIQTIVWVSAQLRRRLVILLLLTMFEKIRPDSESLEREYEVS